METCRVKHELLSKSAYTEMDELISQLAASINSPTTSAALRDNLIRSLLSYITDESTLQAISRLAEERLRRVQAFDEPFSLLPRHVCLKILGDLDPVSLCRCLMVSRHWNELAKEPRLWKSLCCEGPRAYRIFSPQLELEQLQRHTSTDGSGIAWRRVFGQRYRLHQNWHSGRCVIRTFAGHDQGVSAVQFDRQRIVSGSSDSMIRIWDLRSEDGSGVGRMTLTGHSATVRCLHLNGSRLASGSNDFSIKIWELALRPTWSHIACRRTLLGHTNAVRCLQMDERQLVSGSYDTQLRIWSLESGDCIRTLHGHTDAVLCLQYCADEQRLLSGSADQSIRVWDERTPNGPTGSLTIHNAHESGSKRDAITSKRVLMIYEQLSAVTCLRFDSHRIVSGSVDRTLKMWDVRSGRCLQTIDWKAAEGHTGVVRCLQTDAWRIVSAADDRTIKVWKLGSGERICTLQGHTDGVTCVQFDDNWIVSGSYDRTVKLWDFSAC